MIDSREIIEKDTTPEQWDDFERKVEMLEPKELAEIADRIGLRISSDADWRDYLKEFGRQTWWDFTEAYEHVMATDY
jgi:hypothetical protein